MRPRQGATHEIPATLARCHDVIFEDFQVGQKFGSGTVNVTADRIKAFAAEFDPQPFHLDEEAARGTFFGELVASGWHTAAMTMRLLVEGEMHAGRRNDRRGRRGPALAATGPPR